MEDMEDNINTLSKNTSVDTLNTLWECSQCLVVLGTECSGVSLYIETTETSRTRAMGF